MCWNLLKFAEACAEVLQDHLLAFCWSLLVCCWSCWSLLIANPFTVDDACKHAACCWIASVAFYWIATLHARSWRRAWQHPIKSESVCWGSLHHPSTSTNSATRSVWGANIWRLHRGVLSEWLVHYCIECIITWSMSECGSCWPHAEYIHLHIYIYICIYLYVCAHI